MLVNIFQRTVLFGNYIKQRVGLFTWTYNLKHTAGICKKLSASRSTMSFQLNSVLITDEIDVKCVELLQKNGIKVVKNTKLSKDELLVEIAVSFI